MTDRLPDPAGARRARIRILMNWIKRQLSDIRTLVHNSADRMRIEVWAEQEQYREHGPGDSQRRGWEIRLAWADCLDALVGINARQDRPNG